MSLGSCCTKSLCCGYGHWWLGRMATRMRAANSWTASALRPRRPVSKRWLPFARVTLSLVSPCGLRARRAQRAWVAEVRQFLAENVTPALRAEMAEHGLEYQGGELHGVPAQDRRKGLVRAELAAGVRRPWPHGHAPTPADERVRVRRRARPDLTVTSVAPMIMRHGTEQNKKEFLPGIARGEIVFAVGYSEPNAGTDLASLRTRAVRDGDEWVINGSKIWNSGAQRSTHEWLCVRTDPDAPRHRGISVIIVPVDSPGVEIRPLYAWSGYRTNETFFHDVRVPVTNLIGEVNCGVDLHHRRSGPGARRVDERR